MDAATQGHTQQLPQNSPRFGPLGGGALEPKLRPRVSGLEAPAPSKGPQEQSRVTVRKRRCKAKNFEFRKLKQAAAQTSL